jgi:hypothetical protein
LVIFAGKNGIALVSITIANASSNRMQFSQGMKYDSIAIGIGEELHDTKLQADAWIGLATNAYFIGNILHKSLDYAFKALRLYESERAHQNNVSRNGIVGQGFTQYFGCATW